MDSGPAPNSKSRNVSPTAAEIEIATGSSGSAAPARSTSPAVTESQLVLLLSESRREADALRHELAAVRKKADADHRRLQTLTNSNTNTNTIKSSATDHAAHPQIRAYQERLARAEAALAEAEARSRFVEQNWLQVERYLSAVQRQAADARAAFARLVQQDDGGRLVLPRNDTNDEPSARRLPLREYISSSGSGHYAASASTFHQYQYHPHRAESSVLPMSPSFPRMRSPEHYIRPLPRRRPSSPLRSPSAVGDTRERWHAEDRYSRSPSPLHKRQRTSGSGSGSGSGRGVRSPSPPPHGARMRPGASSPPLARKHEVPPRQHSMPPPSPPPAHRPYLPSETLRTYDARNPPLQFIQHRHPTPPPRAPPLQEIERSGPTAPPASASSGAGTEGDAKPHQYQHRFHLTGAATHGQRRLVRPGAYETVVFALDEE
ncbi:hypothetical protein B0H19DRAFT_1200939 [Mycena capillaripes]|nr:hypothetical protein B0H19DRAFT_1200939 [Mycena capillaripes]